MQSQPRRPHNNEMIKIQIRYRKEIQGLIVILNNDWSDLILQIGYLLISSENITPINQTKLQRTYNTEYIYIKCPYRSY